MWWLLPTALAGKLVPSVLPGCGSAAQTLASARAAWEAEGLPKGTVALELRENPMCCVAMVVRPVDATGAALPGSLALNSDCTLLGVSTGATDQPIAPHAVHALVGPPATAPTAASLLRPAYAAMAERSDRFEDLLVGVRTARGWEVWLVRPNTYDLLTVSRAVFDGDGTLQEVVDDVRTWVPPAGAEAARTVWSIEGVRFQ